jgi:glutamate transport system substrate-binding protein
MRVNRVLRAAAVVAALALSVTACGGKAGSGGKQLTVGIKFDQPGLGLKTGEGYTGFDVDVAKYIAKKMGVADADLHFKQAPSNQREDMIQKGDVDLVIATYSINDKRKASVSFAGPYFIAGQSLLVKNDSTVTGPDNLNGKKLCSASGSTSAQTIKDKYSSQVALQQYGGYSECVTGLLSGAIDAISTDDIILAGYAAANPGKLKLVGKPFTVEKYGIGLKKGDTKLQGEINGYIQDMEADGSWKGSLEKNLGANYEIPQQAPAVTEK